MLNTFFIGIIISNPLLLGNSNHACASEMRLFVMGVSVHGNSFLTLENSHLRLCGLLYPYLPT